MRVFYWNIDCIFNGDLYMISNISLPFKNQENIRNTDYHIFLCTFRGCIWDKLKFEISLIDLYLMTMFPQV